VKNLSESTSFARREGLTDVRAFQTSGAAKTGRVACPNKRSITELRRSEKAAPFAMDSWGISEYRCGARPPPTYYTDVDKFAGSGP